MILVLSSINLSLQPSFDEHEMRLLFVYISQISLRSCTSPFSTHRNPKCLRSEMFLLTTFGHLCDVLFWSRIDIFCGVRGIRLVNEICLHRIIIQNPCMCHFNIQPRCCFFYFLFFLFFSFFYNVQIHSPVFPLCTVCMKKTFH